MEHSAKEVMNRVMREKRVRMLCGFMLARRRHGCLSVAIALMAGANAVVRARAPHVEVVSNDARGSEQRNYPVMETD